MKIHSNALYSYLLQDLSESLPETDLTVGFEEWPGITGPERQATALLASVLKKFKDQKNEDADAKALDLFLQSNIGCKEWELRLENSGDELMFGQFRKELYDFFTSKGYSIVPDTARIADLGRVGPGASLGATGKDFYSKLFSSRLTSTSEGLWTIYQHYVCNSSTWSRAEQHRMAEYGGVDIVAGNRLSFVDKKREISRVICTEPSLNMFFQLGLGKLFERRLRSYFGIDLEEQPFVNRELARVGSMSGDLSTIDLSAASDSVSSKMLEATLPPDILGWLGLLRSNTCTLPDGSVERLHMISSMGNGFTFPLETIVFACVVAAVYRIEGIPLIRTKRSWSMTTKEMVHRMHIARRYGHILPEDPSQIRWERGNFGVFGDDIIVESRAANKVVRLLNILGFQVNSDKSFFEGPFRESCGADYFDGLPVRGVYIKSLRSQSSRYVAINRLNEWSALTGFPLRRTIQYLMKAARKIYVPLHENDDAGIKVPSRIASAMGCSTEGKPHPNTSQPIFGTVKYRMWAPKVSQLKLSESNRTIRGPGKRRCYNDEGLFLAYLRGDIIDGKWAVRQLSPHYHTKWSTTLFWDRVPTIGKQFPIGTKALAKAIAYNVLL